MGFIFSLKMVMKRWSVEGGRKVVLGPQNCFYWGAAAPQTPCCSWGAGGLQPPVPSCSIFERLRRSSSPFFLVPRSFGDPVLGDGGTALSAHPNRYPFFTVRTPQASLVGEKQYPTAQLAAQEHFSGNLEIYMYGFQNSEFYENLYDLM